MNFKTVNSYISVDYEGRFFTEKHIKEAFKIGKKLLKYGFYCKDSSYEMTEYFVLCRIPTTNINIGLQLLPCSKNSVCLRMINSAEFYPNPDNLTEHQGDIIQTEYNYEIENFDSVVYETEIINESDLESALRYWYKRVIDFCEDVRNKEKEEYKTLISLIKNKDKFLEKF